MNTNQGPSGWIVLDKHSGEFCTRLIGKVKRIFGNKKAGHAGTLDPFATGVLPIALGEATKTMPYISARDKRYVFQILWGEETDTLDSDGQVTATCDVRPSTQQLQDILPQFIGQITQIPPKYSAIHIDGKRAYDLARRGVDFEVPSRQVDIYDLVLLECADSDHSTLEVHCASGTYVRAIARDIAYALGTLATVVQLRRTAFGPITQGDAISLDELMEKVHKGGQTGILRPNGYVLDGISVCQIGRDLCDDVRLGRTVDLANCYIPSLENGDDQRFRHDELVAIYCGADLLAMAKVVHSHLQPIRVLHIV